MDTDDLIANGRITVDQWRIAHGLEKLPNGIGEVKHIPIGKKKDLLSPVIDGDVSPSMSANTAFDHDVGLQHGDGNG
jgi:hypothetical protein